MDELKRIYRTAMQARIRALEVAQAALDTDPETAAAAIRREAHSLRGSGATYGFPEVTDTAAAVEQAAAELLGECTARLLIVLREVAGGRSGTRILAVDDDPEIQLLLRYLLARDGRELVLAGSAAEAEACLARESFDLVLLDLVLPDADGRALLRLIRGLPGGRELPVLVLSGRETAAARSECLALGAQGFIGKPFDPEAVAAAVAAALGERALAGSSRGDD